VGGVALIGGKLRSGESKAPHLVAKCERFKKFNWRLQREQEFFY